jgi:hypothetical protein
LNWKEDLPYPLENNLFSQKKKRIHNKMYPDGREKKPLFVRRTDKHFQETKANEEKKTKI